MSQSIEGADDQAADVAKTLERLAGCVMLHDLVRVHATERPDRVAVQNGTATLTYADMLHRSERLAARLTASGLEPEDRIALLSKNDVGFVELSMAASMAGLVLVPLSFRLAQPEVDFILDDSGARLLFAGAGSNEMARAALNATEACDAVIDVTADGRYGGWVDSNDWSDGIRSPGSTVLHQLHTSGTTGQHDR